MEENIKYIVSYSRALYWYDVYKEKHDVFDSKEDAIKKFYDYGGFIMGDAYDCNYGGARDEDPDIDVYITRIEIDVRSRQIKSERLKVEGESLR